MKEILARLQRAAPTARKVLLLGETGVGKEVLAGLVHRLSGRGGRFVAVNCASVRSELADATLFGAKKGAYTGATTNREGFAQAAHLGTLFLDEIGELPASVQAKLLRFVETGEAYPVGGVNPVNVDVRIVVATNATGPDGSLGTTLRRDLLARLEEEVVVVPPLCERREEIVALVMHQLAEEGQEPQAVLSAGFLEHALLQRWPGNVRQLLSAVSGCLVHLQEGQRLSAGHLDRQLDRPWTREESSAHRPPDGPPSKEGVEIMLEEAGGNVSEAARRAGVARRTFQRWMRRCGL